MIRLEERVVYSVYESCVDGCEEHDWSLMFIFQGLISASKAVWRAVIFS